MIVATVEEYHSYHLLTNFYPEKTLSNLIPYAVKIKWLISVDFDLTDKLLPVFTAQEKL
jgi:hypothetical protein